MLTALYAGGELNPRAFRTPYARASDPYEAALASNIAQILYPSPLDPTVSTLDLYQRDTDSYGTRITISISPKKMS